MSACVEDSVWSVVNKMTASVWMKILQTTGDGGSPKRMFGRIYGKQMMFKEFLLYQVFRRCQSERMLWDGLSEMQICPKTNNMTLSFPFLSFLTLCRTFILYFFHYLRTSQEDKVCDAAKCSSSERWRTKAENWLKGKSEWVNKRVSGWIMNVWMCVTLCKHRSPEPAGFTINISFPPPGVPARGPNRVWLWCHSVTSPERWCCWGRTDNSITSCCSSAELQNLDSNTLNASKL